MTVQTETTTKPRTALLGRIGVIGTIAGGVVFAIPVLYALYAQLTGNVSLSSADQITALFTYGIILCLVALVLGVVALALNGSGLLRKPRQGMVTTPISAVLLILTAAFLFVMVLPRASAIQTLNDKVVPFAITMRDHCRTPLNAVTADLTKSRDDAGAHLKDDAGFAAAMQADAAKLSADVTSLNDGLPSLQNASVPLSKYQSLKDGCVSAVKGEADFLTNSNGTSAIALPAPYSAVQKTIAVVPLLQVASAEATGSGPVPVQPGTIEPLISFALGQIVAQLNNSPTGAQLTAEGDDLTKYISTTLDSNLAPFKSTIPIQ